MNLQSKRTTKLLPLTFKNSLTKGKVKLIKEDDVESSKALAGAVFTLQDATGKEIMKDLTTDDHGVLVIPDLAPGIINLSKQKPLNIIN